MDSISLNKENGLKLWANDWNKLVSTINLIIDAVNDQNNLPEITKLSQLVNDSGFITSQDVTEKVNRNELSQVATSGSYNDLKDKPSYTTGPQGPEGKSAYQVAVLNGFVGTQQLWLNSLKGEPGQDGVIGLDGADGKSAYELAVELGYEGTLELWLGSLLGADGTNGANGKSAYQSYLDTTTDNPPLTEEQWSANTSNGSSRFTDTNEEIVYNVNSNNHDYVDLCLPSGTLWSTMNLGASSVLEEGLFFTLGGLQGYSLQEVVGHALYPYYNNDSITSLPIEYDSARHLWAGEWEMPTKKQIEELLRYTTQEIVLIEGVNVLKLTSKSNLLKYIYFPLSQLSIDIQEDNNTYELSDISHLSHNLWIKDGIDCIKSDFTIFYGTSWQYTEGYEKGFWNDSDLRSELHHIRPIINNLNGYHRRLQEICFSGSYNDLYDIPTISYKELTNTPKKVSLFENDNLYLTYTSLENRYLTVPTALVTSYGNSHDYYDICGTFWSRYDIGEDSIHDQGMLFRLGDPTGHYPSENFLFTELSYREYISQINSNSYYSVVTELNAFNPVSQNFGSHWRYPTEEDIRNLYTYSKAEKFSKYLYFKSLKYANSTVIYFNLTDSDSVTMRIQGGLVIMRESDYIIRRYKYSSSIDNDYFQNLTEECYGGYTIRPILDLPKKVSMIGITGDYNDLINQPTIPAAQIQADWNQTDNTQVDYIKNKPTITNGTDGVTPHIDSTTKHWIIGSTDTGVVAEGLNGQNGTNGTDGHTPLIAASKNNGVTTITSDGVAIATINDGQDGSVANQLQADWNQLDNSLVDYIKNKPTIPVAVSDLQNNLGFLAIANEHEYIEIGGLKWATMNIGANLVTDIGLYFQWGDTQGYIANQVGSGSGLKYFGWDDYKYTNDGGTTMSKYNSTDGKTVLEASDDAVTAAWGSQWRTPTYNEFLILSNATTITFTENYKGSGVAGMVCTDKTDNSKVLFFPLTGKCSNGNINDNMSGGYWTGDFSKSDARCSNAVEFYKNAYDWGGPNWDIGVGRNVGFAIRGIMHPSIQKFVANVAISGDYNDLSNKPTIPAAPVQSDWNESNSSSLAYIANKPSIPSTTGMVTSSTTGLKIEVVASLPASPDSNTIYIVQ